ncbi:DUF3616 domain-containing protein [Azospirillum sp. A39]|uniref:DUF3616 domain-containing protein n=1 Tax=Azospirillum sp. A39 TaxID=3462279 RepID=UPI004045B41F
MPHRPADRLSAVPLDFRHHEEIGGHLDEPIRANLSAIETDGETLFAGSDEGARVERLVRVDRGYGDHRSYPLGDFFDLPAGQGGEADIEGLALDGGWLWIAGSHSLARKKPKPDEHDAAACLERLTEVKRDPNRFLLGRIPVCPATDAPGRLEPVRSDGGRTAACLKMGSKRNALAKALKDDEHIGRFIDVPAKENGFDVEGLAARGDRLFLGLRGPVLRGWACILELRVEEKRTGRLRLAPVGRGGRCYAKHFLDLDGLGVRELTFDGDDLLILAGPTMDLDGPVIVYHWTGVLDATDETVVPRGRLSRALDLPYGTGFDHAEGMAHRDAPDGRGLLVVYDNPGADRRHADGRGVDADLFAIP